MNLFDDKIDNVLEFLILATIGGCGGAIIAHLIFYGLGGAIVGIVDWFDNWKMRRRHK